MGDIIFNCPHCTKSLAIDERGAGRKVKCVDCGNELTVPSLCALDENPSSSAASCRDAAHLEASPFRGVSQLQ